MNSSWAIPKVKTITPLASERIQRSSLRDRRILSRGTITIGRSCVHLRRRRRLLTNRPISSLLISLDVLLLILSLSILITLPLLGGLGSYAIPPRVFFKLVIFS